METFYSTKNTGLNFRKFPVGTVRTLLRDITRFSKIFNREFPFHLILLPEFPEFSVKWFTSRNFNNFWIFRKLSNEISVSFAPFQKFRNLWLNGALLFFRHAFMYLWRIITNANTDEPIRSKSQAREIPRTPSFNLLGSNSCFRVKQE